MTLVNVLLGTLTLASILVIGLVRCLYIACTYVTPRR